MDNEMEMSFAIMLGLAVALGYIFLILYRIYSTYDEDITKKQGWEATEAEDVQTNN
jgi:hypothetical protein